MLFVLKVGNDIVLSDKVEQTFTKFTYMSNSIDNDIREKNSVDARNEFTFEGIITPNNYPILKKVADWAILPSKVYREIHVIVYDESFNEDVEVRHYNFDEVFCIDYTEEFDNAKGNKFTLFMAQKKIGTKKEITYTEPDGDEDE